MTPDYTKQLDAIVSALNKCDWVTPLVGILGVIVGLLVPFALERWKIRNEIESLLDVAYQEVASQFGALIGLLHTYKINAPQNISINFDTFKASAEQYNTVMQNPKLRTSTKLSGISNIHQVLGILVSSYEGRMAMGKDNADLATRAIFDIEDIVLRGGIDKPRFCKFIDPRIAKRLLNGESTEEFWRSSTIQKPSPPPAPSQP